MSAFVTSQLDINHIESDFGNDDAGRKYENHFHGSIAVSIFKDIGLEPTGLDPIWNVVVSFCN